MGLRHVAVAVMAATAVGCGAAAPGWHGKDIHLVDGTWIGTEHHCHSGEPDRDLECTTIVERTLANVPEEIRVRVRVAVVADLPTTFVTTAGEARTARLQRGTSAITAVVLDLSGGERRVVGVSCFLPYSGGAISGLIVREVVCQPLPLDWWREGGVPPSYPPGTTFG